MSAYPIDNGTDKRQSVIQLSLFPVRYENNIKKCPGAGHCIFEKKMKGFPEILRHPTEPAAAIIRTAAIRWGRVLQPS